MRGGFQFEDLITRLEARVEVPSTVTVTDLRRPGRTSGLVTVHWQCSFKLTAGEVPVRFSRYHRDSSYYSDCQSA